MERELMQQKVNIIFKPNFKYTDKIVKNLVDIASARETVINSYLVPKWEVSLRKDSLIRATHASTAIEGNPLTIEEVSIPVVFPVVVFRGT